MQNLFVVFFRRCLRRVVIVIVVVLVWLDIKVAALDVGGLTWFKLWFIVEALVGSSSGRAGPRPCRSRAPPPAALR